MPWWPVINLVSLIHGYSYLILIEIVVAYRKLRSLQGTQVNFSKFINRGSHRDVSHQGIWTGFIQGTTRVHIQNNVQYSNNNILK